MLYLARHDRRPIYQHLALWDESLGSIQHTRYITPHRKEELLFCLGPYVYLWYDPSVAPAIEENLPLFVRVSGTGSQRSLLTIRRTSGVE